jgi:hypothetical protein
MKFTLWINIHILASVNHQGLVRDFSFSCAGESFGSFVWGFQNGGKLSRYERFRQKVSLEKALPY